MTGVQSSKGAPAAQVAVSRDQASTINGSGGEGILLNSEKDQKTSSTEAKQGELLQNIQARYGAKPEKAREIKKTLGKDDFLRIMVTQMKNQDPTSPFKAEQMATQLAQFTSVEQLQNMNQQMGKMLTANQPLERLALTNMIGKTITIDRERFPHVENEASTLGYTLPAAAKEVKISVLGENGEVVMSKDLGPMKEGEQSYVWDGVKNNSLATKTGNYIFRIDAKDAAGKVLPMNTKGQASVVGVSFEGSQALLLVGDINSPQKVSMQNVVRVDSNGSDGMIPGARSLKSSLGAGAPNRAMAPNGNAPAEAGSGDETSAATKAALLNQPTSMFTFQKGVGSKPLDPSSMSPEAARAIEMYQSAKNAASAQASASDSAKDSSIAPVEKNNSQKKSREGFPNGLNSGDN